MKKIVLLVTAVLLAGIFTSCSSDDNAAAPVSPLVGVWKAETASYTFAGQTHTFEYNVDGGPFAGCEVDFLTLSDDHSALLLEHIKNENEGCDNVESAGTWNDDKVHVKGADRVIDYSTKDELVLTYDLIYYGQVLPITVEYSKM